MEDVAFIIGSIIGSLLTVFIQFFIFNYFLKKKISQNKIFIIVVVINIFLFLFTGPNAIKALLLSIALILLKLWIKSDPTKTIKDE